MELLGLVFMIIILCIAWELTDYIFKRINNSYVFYAQIIITVIMLSSFWINYSTDNNLAKAIFNMYAIFFAIDVDVVRLLDIKELAYYIIKTIAIFSTFYIVIIGFVDSIKKEKEIEKAKKELKDCLVIFGNESKKEYIKKHFKKHSKFNLQDANILGEDAYDAVQCLIYFDNDQESLNFYAENKDKLKSKEIALVLNDIESSLFYEENYHIVNFHEIIARNFWLNEINLYEIIKNNKKVIISLIGLDSIGRNIFKYGLLNNIYDTQQQIIYKVWGDKNVFDTLNIDLSIDTRDIIIYMGDTTQVLIDDSIKAINKSDVCIINIWDSLILQEVISRAYRCKYIWIYDKSEMSDKVSTFFVKDALNLKGDKGREIKFFGKILIDEEILYKTDLINRAKNVHYLYSNKKIDNMDDAWKKLDIYSRRSCLTCAEYEDIRDVYAKDKEYSELCVLEHARWCRFMFLDDWKYANISKKDKVNKCHPDLIKFDELPIEDRDKDKAILEKYKNREE